jgi:hypothetical protein
MAMGRLAIALLFACALAMPSWAAERSAIFLFGPEGAEHARQTAHAAASTARRWLKQPGSTAELRRTGSADIAPLDGNVPAKPLDELFLKAAREGRDSDPAALLTALDSAAQALGRRPGLRLLVAVVENPPLSGEAETALNQIVEFCQSNSVRVVILDPTEIHSKGSATPLETLAARTGGTLIRDPKSLDTAVLTVTAGPKDSEPAEAGTSTGQPAPAGQLPPLPADLPVHTRFIRISSSGSQSFGTQMSVGAGRGGFTEVDGGPNIEYTTGPARGLLFVESPLSALHFDIDDNAGTFQARARMTQIVRNASGKIVWQASKAVTVRGPLRKLQSRKAGNLYYLREVQLPAGQYTLEALVEDLIAGKSGAVREPLRTGRGLPGFDVSDALLVRPFNGAGDRFEADQILSYDGDAISPLLDPVYRANEPFNLQIYIVIYPDMYGPQPELSLEVLQNGHVVGRSALPFTDRIHNDSTEGGGTSMVGEQKHQFPYMATLRGAKLGGGEFEARVNVRQGRKVLTRSVTFHVIGDPQPADAPGSGQTAGSSAAAEDEIAEVTLPEVEPVHLNASGASLPEAEQQRLWEEAAADAMSYTSRLPNFRCHRETRRLAAPVRSPDQFREGDSLIEELTYENGKESYRTLEVNGQKSGVDREKLEGVRSRGEFGSMLKSIFRPEISARYKWAGRAMTGGVLCQVFDIDVPAAKSNFVLMFNLSQAVAAYHGRVFIDEETGLVRRIVMQGTDLPKQFGLQSPSFSLEYGMVRVGDKDHLLPLRSVLQVRQGRRLVRNETLFRDYRRFEAESQIRFQ